MKARIEFDVPVDCADCPLFYPGGLEYFCSYDNHTIEDEYIRPDWCPLQIIEDEI